MVQRTESKDYPLSFQDLVDLEQRTKIFLASRLTAAGHCQSCLDEGQVVQRFFALREQTQTEMTRDCVVSAAERSLQMLSLQDSAEVDVTFQALPAQFLKQLLIHCTLG